MRKMRLFMLLALLSLPALTWAVAAPTGLTLGPYGLGNAEIAWDDDVSARSWQIFFDGALKYAPTRSQVGTSTTTKVRFHMAGIGADKLPVTITMKALRPGQIPSALSTGVILTGVNPGEGAVQVFTVPGQPLDVTVVFPTPAPTPSGGTVVALAAGAAVGVTRVVGVIVEDNGVTQTLVEVVVTGTSILGNTLLIDPVADRAFIMDWNMSVDVSTMLAGDKWFLEQSGGGAKSATHYVTGPNDDCTSSGGSYCASVAAGTDLEVDFDRAGVDFSFRGIYFTSP